MRQALAALETNSPAIAVLDINVAGESSLPAAQLLASRGVPIISATGYRDTGLTGASAGFPCLQKPIATDELARLVADLIGSAGGPAAGGR